MLRDIRLALRLFLKEPASAAIALSVLAIAIGANTAIFSVLNAALLKLLPVHKANELVMLTDPNASLVLGGMVAGERPLLGYEEFTQLRDRSKTMAGVCASQLSFQRWPVRIAGAQQEQARGRLVSENYFAVFGVQPALGRLFMQSDAAGPGKDPFAVISYDYWQRRFGGKRSVLGAAIRVHRAAVVIIGVAAEGFRGETVGQNPDVWLPMLMQPLVMPGSDSLHDFFDNSRDKLMWLHVFGRSKTGVNLSQVQAEVSVLFRQILENGYPASMEPSARREALNQQIRVKPLRSGAFHGRNEFAQEWSILSALAALVLLIACANAGNLLLARAVARSREVAIRLSMGARRSRLFRQFLIESLLLATLAGIAGVFVAILASHALLPLLARGNDRFELAAALDWRVFAFTACIVLFAGILFGLAPAWYALHMGVNESLKNSGKSAMSSRQRTTFSKTLVAAQVTLSFLLVLGAGLFLQTLHNLENVPLGYPRQNLLLVDVDTTGAMQQSPNLARELAARIREIPGVSAVAYSDRPFLNGFDGAFAVGVEGFSSSAEADRGSTGGFVGPGYFSTIGIPVLLGREIGPYDTANSPRVCVVNEAFAKHFLGRTNPIGKHVTINSTSMEIVGVTKDARVSSLRGAIEPKFYAPADQNFGGSSFEIRTVDDPNRMMGTVRASVSAVDDNLLVAHAQTLVEKIDELNAQSWLITRVCAAFAAIAVFLAAIGIYAVLSYSVTRRINEIGIRVALGADKRRIAAMILEETGGLVLAGLIAGIAAARVLARLLAIQLYGTTESGPRWSLANYEHVDTATRLYGIGALDLPTIATTITILSAIGLVAAYLPAARAARVDPASALRHE